MSRLFIARYQDTIPANCLAIDTTSRSVTWSKGLSPFYLGPIPLYGNHVNARIMENAWQYSKVYAGYTDEEGNPNESYFAWARDGWSKNYPVRYPMGKNAVPRYSYWDGEKLDYISARKKIYIPLYANAVKKTEAYQELAEIFITSDQDIYLQDFDSYNISAEGKTIEDALNDPYRKMGHAFVLYMLLTGFIWN